MSRLRLATRLAPVVVGIAALTVACGSSKAASSATGTPAATTATTAAAPTSAAETSMPSMPSMSVGADDSSAPPSTQAAAGGVTITIKGFQFGDPTGPVKAGDTVTVINMDSVAHTYQDVNGAFESHNIPANGGKATFVAPKAGTYKVKCNYHPSMHGTLTVT